MPLFEEFILPSCAIGQVDGADVRIRALERDSIRFETLRPIGKKIDLALKLYDAIEAQGYVELTLRGCAVQKLEEGKFSSVYSAALPPLDEKTRALYQRSREEVAIVSRIEVPSRFRPPDPALQQRLRLDKRLRLYNDRRAAGQTDLAAEDTPATYEALTSEWLDVTPTAAEGKKFARLAKKVERALLVNRPWMYPLLDDGDFQTAARGLLARVRLDRHPLFAGKIARVQLGNDYCHHLLPSTPRMLKLVSALHAQGVAVTIVLPVLVESEAPSTGKLLQQLDGLASPRTPLEVVVNDWGMLHLCRERAPKLEPVLGRMLNKVKKDPRFHLTEPDVQRRMGENNLELEEYRSFLAELGVRRYEYEATLNGRHVVAGQHSLHLPYFQLATSTFCALYARVTAGDDLAQTRVEKCALHCERLIRAWPARYHVIGCGNSLIGLNPTVLKQAAELETYVEQGIDRVVLNAEVAE